MCGIIACIGSKIDMQKQVDKLRSRGPEGIRIFENMGYQLGFTRLAINGLSNQGMQPMHNPDFDWICNGEIYNFRELARQYDINLTTGSDCEILGYLLNRVDYKTLFNLIDGVFATVIIDNNANTAIIARDPYGVRPLFYCQSFSKIIVASEVKAFPKNIGKIKAFPPGCYMTVNLQTLYCEIERYHHIPDDKHLSVNFQYLTDLRNALTNAVSKRLMTERPMACLLSGGLDSSLIAALVQKELKFRGLSSLKTFSIGFENSEDLRYAKKVADYIGSDHTEIIMTPDDFFSAIPQVIHDIESYDITTVRASVGNWLVAREIARKTDCKVIFNGDGSDEVFGGYLYFYKSPNEYEFERETERLLRDIHYFDVLRSDRCISSHGLEPRTPFLDKEFVRVAKSINTIFRRPTSKQCEKYVIRNAFAGQNLLPDEVLWRTKEAFSDGVSNANGKCWYQECQERASKIVPLYWRDDAKKFKYLTPQTAESYYYRKLFAEFYGDLEDTNVPYFWMPKWSPETSDPSAKTLNPTTSYTS